MADDSSSSNNSAAHHNRWIDRLQEKQGKLAENRAEIRRILEYRRQVDDDEVKKATLAGILAGESQVPGDEWRARLEASERHQRLYTGRGTSSSQPQSQPQQQQQQQQQSSSVGAPSTAAAHRPSVTFTDVESKEKARTSSPTSPSSTGAKQNYYPYSSVEEATRRAQETRQKAEEEAALRIKLAKDHVAYVEAVHAREDAIREKSQSTREAALLHEILAARQECRRHVSEAEMSSRNQEDLMRIISALKKQLGETTKELEYARKEIDFTGRETQVKKSECTDLRVELALMRKNNEKLEQKLQKRESFIAQLEREKGDILIDCKKLIKDRQEAEDRLTEMTTSFEQQQKQFEEFRREAAVAPHFRAGAPAPMIFEAHRRVSPSQYSKESSAGSTNLRSRSPSMSRASGNQLQQQQNNNNANGASNSCNTIHMKDLQLLLRDLYADMTSCPLLRKAVAFDTARSGPQALPLIFDRARWEEVKRKYVYGHHQSSSKNANETQHQDDEGDVNQASDAPYRAYEEYRQQQQQQQRQKTSNNNNATKRTSSADKGVFASNSQTTCKRCGHSHHCHHRCAYCTGQTLQHSRDQIVVDQSHKASERAHVTRTISPVKLKQQQKRQQQQQKTQTAPAAAAPVISSGGEASDERTSSSNDESKKQNKTAKHENNEYFRGVADSAQRRLDKIAAKIDNDGEDDGDDEEEGQISPMSISDNEKTNPNNNNQIRAPSTSTTTVTSIGVAGPFREYVAANDRLAREARRGNRFVPGN